MNALLWLQLPWRAPHQSLGWIVVLLLLAAPLGLLGIYPMLADNAASWKAAAGLCAVALFLLWMFSLPATLLLAIDARQLCLPRVERQVFGSLLLYGVLSVAVPTTWLVSQGAAALPVTAILTLACCAGLVCAIVPRYLVVMLCFTPSLVIAALRPSRIRQADAADLPLIPLAAALALVLLLIVVWRVRRLVRGGASQTQGWSAPIVLLLRNGSWGQWGGIGENRALRRIPNWLRAEPDLTDVGPAQPGKSMRVALGGWYLPQTWPSYARQLVVCLSAFSLPLLYIPVLDWMGSRHTSRSSNVTHDFLDGALGSGLAVLVIMAGTLIGVASLAFLTRRWRRTNAELPLLALLPGLGDAARVRRALMRAGLGLPLAMHAAVACLLMAMMLFWPQHARELGFLLLSQCGSAAVTTALLLNLFGGKGLELWSSGLLLGLCQVLTIGSATIALMTADPDPVGWSGELLPPLVLAWLLLGLAMVWLGHRGWVGLVQKPHPFLPN